MILLLGLQLCFLRSYYSIYHDMSVLFNASYGHLYKECNAVLLKHYQCILNHHFMNTGSCVIGSGIIINL